MNFEDTGCTTLDMIGHATISADTTAKGDLTDVLAVSAMPDRAADGPSATAAAGNRTTPVPAMAAAADDGACSTAASCGWCC